VKGSKRRSPRAEELSLRAEGCKAFRSRLAPGVREGLVEETGDEELGRLWMSVSPMHVSFCEGWAIRKHAEGVVEDTERFMERIK